MPNLQFDLQAGTQPKLSSKLGRVWQYQMLHYSLKPFYFDVILTDSPCPALIYLDKRICCVAQCNTDKQTVTT